MQQQCKRCAGTQEQKQKTKTNSVVPLEEKKVTKSTSCTVTKDKIRLHWHVRGDVMICLQEVKLPAEKQGKKTTENYNSLKKTRQTTINLKRDRRTPTCEHISPVNNRFIASSAIVPSETFWLCPRSYLYR